MEDNASSITLALRSRRAFVEAWLAGLPGAIGSVEAAAHRLAEERAPPLAMMRRRDAADDLKGAAVVWLEGAVSTLRGALNDGRVNSAQPTPASASALRPRFSLVDDETIEGEILSSRLTLAIKEVATWEFSDLRSRITYLEKIDELDAHDVLRPEVLSRALLGTWTAVGLSHDVWRSLQAALHDEFALLSARAYHDVNRLLIEQGVLPEIDLRPLIRGRQEAPESTRSATASVPAGDIAGNKFAQTRLLTRIDSELQVGQEHAQAVLGRLNRLIGRHVREPQSGLQSGLSIQSSEALERSISLVQHDLAQRLAAADAAGSGSGAQGVATALEDLRQHRQMLKAAASTPEERATIEVVALLFQNILTEDRIPATVRVWFARLQMPVLRVAVGEPDFFSTADHPARRLIDCMGACVMGFDANNAEVGGGAVEREIKRVVQVVEAYPDTGSRVFKTVLTEFERFLDNYFKHENEASRQGVSLAAQVEHRETLVIQFTIELRKMLDDVPVHEAIRDFLFQVWADVLAMTSVQSGLHGEEIKVMKGAAADLIWSASAKVSHEERADVIRRLPGLLKVLRDGMSHAGLSLARQDEQIQRVNQALALAFTARTAPISRERLDQLMVRLETLEEILPDAEDLEIDESLVLDLSGHESSDLEVISAAADVAPSAEMLARARELQVGSWFMLDHRNRNEAVQLAWLGMHRQLSLFVSAQGRCVLFQQHRLAAFLKEERLIPLEEESLTSRATRSALEQINLGWQRLDD